MNMVKHKPFEFDCNSKFLIKYNLVLDEQKYIVMLDVKEVGYLHL